MENLQAVSDFLAMVSSPEVYQAKIKEMQDTKAQLDKAWADKGEVDSVDAYVKRMEAAVNAMLQDAQDKVDAAAVVVKKADDYKAAAMAEVVAAQSKGQNALAEVAVRESIVKAHEEAVKPALDDIDLMTQRLNARKADLDAREAELSAKAAQFKAIFG
jgi:hypothetical protein